ncbi:unnamed protein product [Sphagnum troendelagicum]|uniref:Uncharacterized protein n=1 Tax=Sphagnum troendelagicum TaxID=128251 RepID=A0ABP0UX76_9BRYO
MMAGINGSVATVFAGGSPITIFTHCNCKGLASASSCCFSPGGGAAGAHSSGGGRKCCFLIPPFGSTFGYAYVFMEWQYETEQLIQELTSRSPIQLAAEEGDKSVTEAEDMILSSLSLYALSPAFQLVCPKMEAGMVCMPDSQCGYPKAVADEVAAEEEAAKAKQDGVEVYTQADVVVALAGWDENSAQPASEGSLRALKYLLEADNELPGKKSLYLHLGCCGDWPNIMPPGWDPATGKQQQPGQAMVL